MSAASTTPDPTPNINERIGRYRILERLGEAGMGTVYLVEQEEPIRRRAALKLIKPGLDSAGVLARFEAERQALALASCRSLCGRCGAGTRASPTPRYLRPALQVQGGRSALHARSGATRYAVTRLAPGARLKKTASDDQLRKLG